MIWLDGHGHCDHGLGLANALAAIAAAAGRIHGCALPAGLKGWRGYSTWLLVVLCHICAAVSF